MQESTPGYPANEDGLRDALAALERDATHIGFAAQTRAKLLLVTEELYTNTLHHGTTGSGARIYVRVVRADANAALSFEDEGPPYDPFAAVQAHERTAALDVPVEDRPVGRLGIVLIQGLAVTARYLRKPGRNRIDVVIADQQ